MKRQDIQDATGRVEYLPGRGTIQAWPGQAGVAATGIPANGTTGFAPSCIWQNLLATGNGPYLYLNVGTFTSSTWIPIDANIASAQGFVELPIQQFRAVATNDIPAQAGTPIDGVLALDSAPLFKRVNAATDKALRVQWTASSLIEITTRFMYPPDMDVTKTYTVNLRAAMAGATDIPTVAVGLFEGVGDTNRGGNTGAVTGTAIGTYSATITPTTGAPMFASVSLTPAAHTTDVLYLYGVWVQYTKKALLT